MKINKKEKKQWLRTVAWLKESFPVDETVVVRTISIREKATGSAYLNPESRKFEVKICKKQSFQNRIYTLIHEWAHIVIWHKALERSLKKMKMENSHSKEWGIAYAKIFRTFFTKKVQVELGKGTDKNG